MRRSSEIRGGHVHRDDEGAVRSMVFLSGDDCSDSRTIDLCWTPQSESR